MNEKWYFVTMIILTYCEKKNSSVQEKLQKFETEGREFEKWLISLEKFIQTMKGQFLVTECFFNLFLEVSHF